MIGTTQNWGLSLILSLVFKHRCHITKRNSARCTTPPQQTLSDLAVLVDGGDVMSKFAVIPEDDNKLTGSGQSGAGPVHEEGFRRVRCLLAGFGRVGCALRHLAAYPRLFVVPSYCVAYNSSVPVPLKIPHRKQITGRGLGKMFFFS